MKRILLIFAVLLPMTASADLIRFDFQGKCTISCEDIGLNTNDPVSGFVETLSGLDDDTILWGWELSDFGFNFGSNISISSATHFALGALVSNEERTSLFSSLLFEGMTFQQLFTNPSTGGTTGSLFGALDLDLDGWVASIRVTTCQGFFNCSTDISYGAGPGSYTAISAPASLGLIGIGLLAFGFMRQRESKRLHQAA